MIKKSQTGFILSGLAAGTVNGLFGAGGGMVLAPLLTVIADIHEDEVFPSSVSIILPISLVTLTVSLMHTNVNLNTALIYMIGGSIGGVFAGVLGKKIPTKWLHKLLGILILWGGIRYLC